MTVWNCDECDTPLDMNHEITSWMTCDACTREGSIPRLAELNAAGPQGRKETT